MHSNVPRTLTRNTWSNSSEPISSNRLGRSVANIAALFTKPSMAPNLSSASRARRATAAASVMSQTLPIASPPASLIAAIVASGECRSHTLTRAPSAARAFA